MKRKIPQDKSTAKKTDADIFLTIYEQSPFSIQLLSPDGYTLYVNKAWEELWGLTLDKITDYNMLQDNQLVEEGVMPLIQRGFQGEIVRIPAIKYYPEKTVNGITFIGFRWTKAIMYPVKDEHNRLKMLVLQHEDITEQIEDTNKLKEANLTLQTIIYSSPLAVYVLDADGKVTLWNQFAEKLFGWKEEEIKGKMLPIIPKNKIDEHKELVKRLRNGNTFMRDLVRQKKDGSLIDLIISANPVFDENKHLKAIVAIAADITERKELERRKDEFIGIASHELKTPVTSIKAYGQVLKRTFEREGHEIAVSQLAKMDTQINKLTDLISDLLDVTKIQSGKLIMQNEQFDFNELVKETIEDMQLNTELHILIPELDSSKKITGDRERIGQVLTNLISNAIKYSPANDKIIISTTLGIKDITLCVKDYGVGIPKDKQEKVFEQFFRVSGEKQHTFPGLGLGLYISSEIVKRQGGKIWVESKVGKGATFCFKIPFSNENSSTPKTIQEEDTFE